MENAEIRPIIREKSHFLVERSKTLLNSKRLFLISGSFGLEVSRSVIGHFLYELKYIFLKSLGSV
jgi:hypothetical protein